jgi:hypothetical protein
MMTSFNQWEGQVTEIERSLFSHSIYSALLWPIETEPKNII